MLFRSTMDVYGDNANIIPEEIPELLTYMDEVMPEKSNGNIVKNSVQDIIIDMDKYLPKGKSQERNKT